jgi:hypothetical protein
MSVRRAGAAAITAILLTTFAIVVFPSPAGASLPNYEVVVARPATAPSGQAATSFAVCKSGRPLGGGVHPGTRDLRVVESFPSGAPANAVGWSVTVANEGPNQDSFTVATVCADVTLAYQVAAVTNQPVGPGQTATAKAQCGGGRKPFGGGILTVSNNLRVVSSFPLQASQTNPSGAWTGTVANEGANSSTFDVYAICDDATLGSSQFVVGAQMVGAGLTLAGSLNCPPGKKPVSGGIDSHSPDLRMVESFPLGPTSNPTGWHSIVANTGTQNALFQSYVVCVG